MIGEEIGWGATTNSFFRRPWMRLHDYHTRAVKKHGYWRKVAMESAAKQMSKRMGGEILWELQHKRMWSYWNHWETLLLQSTRISSAPFHSWDGPLLGVHEPTLESSTESLWRTRTRSHPPSLQSLLPLVNACQGPLSHTYPLLLELQKRV